MYGGLPASSFLEGAYFDASDQGVEYMMRLDKVTHLWEPVSCHGAPTGTCEWRQRHEAPSGGACPTPPYTAITSLDVFAGLCYSLVHFLLVLQVFCTKGNSILLGSTV